MSEINFDYKKMYPFKWFILENFPFLEDSIDGLTNYQLFSKLGEEINKNRNSINSLGENQQILTDSYNALADYVNNYFSNLNVQDEINNKLDEMARDGSLYEIINRFVTPLLDEQDEKIEEFSNAQNIRIDNLANMVQSATSGSPLVASSTAGMTDTSRVYVNTTDGKWYYYDGDSWEIGGTYQSTVGTLDPSLTEDEMAPVSSIVGDKLLEKNYDMKYLSGYTILQNPIEYNKNTSIASAVTDVGVTGNTLTFTVAAGQSVKGVSSKDLAIKRGKTYTLKFTVTMSDSSNAITFYYNGGSGTLSRNITGTDTISSTFTRSAGASADGAVVFFITNGTESPVTCTISDLMFFEGSVGDIMTLKTLSDNFITNQPYSVSTTSGGTYTSSYTIEQGKTYKIDVTTFTSNTNVFSSTDNTTSITIRGTGTYYYSPQSTGYLSTYGFGANPFSFAATVTLVSDKNTLYVSTSGYDTNTGLSPTNALATIQKAIELGARNILVKRGKYYHQTINLSGTGESISIKPYDNNSFTASVPDRPVIEIINGTTLDSLTTDATYSALLSQNFSGNAAWTAVFISHTLPPSTEGYRGYNNAGLWQISGGTDYSKDLRITPVLDLADCVDTEGTFYWNGTKVYVHPYDEEYTEFVAQDAIDYGLYLENLCKVELEDVHIKFSKQSNFYIKNCMDIHLQNCLSQYTNVINGFQMNNSNGLLENCQAYNSRDDGFGAQDYGVTTYLNCIGNYNSDDGISHHFGERATIIGGEYAHNGKGGVASPTYGAYVNVYNVYSHHNSRGVYATNESETSYAARTCFVNNCLITNNTVGIEVGGTTKIIGWNNVFDANGTDHTGDYTEYTNQ